MRAKIGDRIEYTDPVTKRVTKGYIREVALNPNTGRTRYLIVSRYADIVGAIDIPSVGVWIEPGEVRDTRTQH